MAYTTDEFLYFNTGAYQYLIKKESTKQILSLYVLIKACFRKAPVVPEYHLR